MNVEPRRAHFITSPSRRPDVARDENAYLRQIENTLPRLLALFDTNPYSPTYGMGDRFHWAWKLIDFGNGTFQGAAHGLARLLANGLLPDWLAEDAVLRRIDAMFHATRKLVRPNGSLEEAFPFESSYCVTALVAFDLLSAAELLGERLEESTRERYLAVIRPLIGFLRRADETHAFISNHLATAATALFQWTALTGETGTGEKRGRELLDRILAAQSEEGWFREYDGADPGYQSLCTYYLADLHRQRPDLELLEPLRRSIRFLWHFAHPDGSFGGYYGSRNTRFYYPAGIEALAAEIPEAHALARFMRHAIERHATIALSSIDEPNLVPLFNAYCLAAACQARTNHIENPPRPPISSPQFPPNESYDPQISRISPIEDPKRADSPLFDPCSSVKSLDRPVLPISGISPSVPAVGGGSWRKRFPEAGLLIDKGPNHYTVVSWHKGGVCQHYAMRNGSYVGTVNAGVVVGDGNRFYSTQSYRADDEPTENGDALVIEASLVAMKSRLPTPGQFIVLRLLNVTLMRWRTLGELVKKALVRLLITGRSGAIGVNRRTIHLGRDLRIEDESTGADGKPLAPLDKVENRPFGAIHMASAGYWQRQDDVA